MSLHNFNVSQRLFSLLTKATGVFVFLAVFILEYILNLNFPCFCRPAWDSPQPIGRHGILYMLFPPIIITCAIMLVDKMYQKVLCCKNCSECPSICTSNCICSFTKLVITFLSVVLYWIAAVFIDGEWYVCYKTNNHPKQVGIPCKQTVNLTYDERLVITDYKTDSVVIGLSLVVVGFVFWHLYEFCITYLKRLNKGCHLHQPYYERLYEEILSEEVNNHLKNELQEIAKERAKRICLPHLQLIRSGNPGNSWQDISDSDLFLSEAQCTSTGSVSLIQNGCCSICNMLLEWCCKPQSTFRDINMSYVRSSGYSS